MRKTAKPAPPARGAQRAKQYTIRDIPPHVDTALRRKAQSEGKSLNTIARDALLREAGVGSGEMLHHDLDDLAGQWVEDPEFDAALEAQDRVDESLWRKR